ncbi:MAG: alkaline phosphatase [Candidatus Aminicenantes bacterium]|nr:alkaline phosphatase [Candidatus Aminicenantes bacterium]
MNKAIQNTKLIAVLLSIIILFLIFYSCTQKGIQEKEEFPKYLFLFIGDGMGFNQMHAAEIIKGASNQKDIGIQKLSFSQFPGTGLMSTFSSNSYITDSAASGTAMASGQKTINGRINLDVTNEIEFTTIAEMAKDREMKVGIISNVSLNHATPASFYAHVTSRWHYYDIAEDMVESGFDFFGGGGIKYPTGRRGLDRDILELAREKGYKVVLKKDDILSLDNEDQDEKVIALNEKLTLKVAMPYRIDTRDDDLSLEDYVDKGIQLLDNDKGFFMMVEGGKIDWAGHDNDAGTLIKEVLDFDRAVQRAVLFHEQHPDETLILVTADHETGGMALGSVYSGYSQSLEVLNGQTISLKKFSDEHIKPYKATKDKEEWNLDDFMPLIKDHLGLIQITEDEKQVLTQKAYEGDEQAQMKLRRALSPREYKEITNAFHDPNLALFGFTLIKILNQKAGISWTSDSHTASLIPVFSLGKGYQRFVGYYDNTELFQRLKNVMGFSTNN